MARGNWARIFWAPSAGARAQHGEDAVPLLGRGFVGQPPAAASSDIPLQPMPPPYRPRPSGPRPVGLEYALGHRLHTEPEPAPDLGDRVASALTDQQVRKLDVVVIVCAFAFSLVLTGCGISLVVLESTLFARSTLARRRNAHDTNTTARGSVRVRRAQGT